MSSVSCKVIESWMKEKTNMDSNLHIRESRTQYPDLSSFFSSFALSWECCSLAFDIPHLSLARMMKRKMLNLIIICYHSAESWSWTFGKPVINCLNWWDLVLPRTNPSSNRTDEWTALVLEVQIHHRYWIKVYMYPTLFEDKSLPSWLINFSFHLPPFKSYLLTWRPVWQSENWWTRYTWIPR